MSTHKRTRREFLKVTGLGAASMALPSCVAPSGRDSTRQPFTFAQVCDTQLGMAGYEHDVKTFEQAVRQINVLKPAFVAICGDLVHNPDETSFADFNRIKAGFDMPCHCVSGNHDVGNEPTPASLQTYRKAVGDDYYTFVHKGCTFVAVNTQLWKAPVPDETEKHDAWLKATLESAAKATERTFVLGHYPLFLRTVDEEDEYMNLPRARRTELLALYQEHGVVAALGGHTHRLLINEHHGMQLVQGETTSKNFDERPLGFRLWHVGDARPFEHEFVPLEPVG